jgi:hypothetical protein
MLKLPVEQVMTHDASYRFVEEFDVNLTLSYENDNWEEWHILREFISNALDSVGGDAAQVTIHSEDGFVTITDTGVGYPLVYAKRIGATNKKDNVDFIGNFGEGVKLSLLACVRKGISVRLLSRNWQIVPKANIIENQVVLMYDIYEADTNIQGTAVVIEANINVMEIINDLPNYFLHFRNGTDCLFGDINNGIYPLINSTARLYIKGVYVKDITALYSYGISLDSLNRDRDVISPSNISQAVKNIWERVDNPGLIKPMIKASALPYCERDKLVELFYGIYPNNPKAWADAFIELYGARTLLHTDDIAEREAAALGYEVINCEYHIKDILNRAGIKNDTETLSDDYELTFVKHLEQDETAMLNRVYELADILKLDIPHKVKVFEDYANHPNIPGLFNQRSHQVYMRKDVLHSTVEEALNVYLHEANHQMTGLDDSSRGFADNLCHMLSSLLLRYANDIGVKGQAHLSRTGDISLPIPYTASQPMYVNVVAVGKKLLIYTTAFSLEIELPVTLSSPICGLKKLTSKDRRHVVKLPGKLISVLAYGDMDATMNCVTRYHVYPNETLPNKI